MQLLGKIELLFGIYKTEMIWYNENKKSLEGENERNKRIAF